MKINLRINLLDVSFIIFVVALSMSYFYHSAINEYSSVRSFLQIIELVNYFIIFVSIVTLFFCGIYEFISNKKLRIRVASYLCIMMIILYLIYQSFANSIIID